MKFIAILLAIVASAQANDIHDAWQKFKVDYGKVYENGKEHARRFSIFRKNLIYINEHNKLFESGKSSYSMGINEYADMTNEEFVAQFNGYVAEGGKGDPANYYVADDKDLPKSVDWRTKGYVTPIKNQGLCGSCWAFSSAGALEGAHAKKTGKLVSLSEQNLVDCVKANFECNGGWMYHSFEYVIKNNGIDTEASYKYTGKNGTCHFKKDDVGATISSYKNITQGSEKDLTIALAKEGPVSVAIDAGWATFQLYKKGIYDEPRCNPEHLDHAVLVVGYGSEDGKDYYIVKNSWGTTWGDKGYIYMSRNKNNQCGIATVPSFPII